MVSNEKILRIEREFKAPPEAVYDAWVTPEIFVRWWGPEGMTTPIHNLDVREGGAWSATMENAEGQQHTSSGVYRVLDRPNRLVFTWAWVGDDGNRGHETEVEVTFTGSTNGTRMVLTQATFEDMPSRDNHNFGWSSSFNDLAKILA